MSVLDVVFWQAVAGLLADARRLMDVAKEESANYQYNFNCQIPLKARGHCYCIMSFDGPNSTPQPIHN